MSLTFEWRTISTATLLKTANHEMPHAMMNCTGESETTCDDVMGDEKLAYYRVGQCSNDRECTDAAWESAKNKVGCSDKKKDDYYGKFDPAVNGSRLPEIPLVRLPKETKKNKHLMPFRYQQT